MTSSVSLIRLGDYKMTLKNPAGEREITIKPKDHKRAYEVKIRESLGGPSEKYILYPPQGQNKQWKVILPPGRTNPKFIDDPEGRWAVLPPNQTSEKIEIIPSTASMVHLVSAVLLVCKLVGWVKVGSWQLYLAVTIVSWIASRYFRKENPADTQFDIANKIYSIVELTKSDVKVIDAQSKLQFDRANYEITYKG